MLYAELQKSHTLIVADKTLITASSVAEISPGSRTKATAEERATNRTTATQSGTYPHKKHQPKRKSGAEQGRGKPRPKSWRRQMTRRPNSADFDRPTSPHGQRDAADDRMVTNKLPERCYRRTGRETHLALNLASASLVLTSYSLFRYV